MVLAAPGLDEEVLDVEGDRGRAANPGPLGEDLVEVHPVVEVGLVGERDMSGPGVTDGGGEARPGQEPHPVAAAHQALRDRQVGAHMTVGRHCREDDRRHGDPSAVGTLSTSN